MCSISCVGGGGEGDDTFHISRHPNEWRKPSFPKSLGERGSEKLDSSSLELLAEWGLLCE